MKRPHPCIVLPALFSALLLFSCTGIIPDPAGINETPANGTDPEDGGGQLPPGYVPQGWTAPTLAYPTDTYCPAEVVGALVSPGQYAKDADFGPVGNLDKLLGFPSGGGTRAPDNSSVVSLGMAGGSVTVRFDPPVENHPDNIGGYDFIVFGNAYWYGGDPDAVWQEPGTIWVMEDTDGEGDMDEDWYLIPGSFLSGSDSPRDVTYHETDPALPPPAEKKDAWWPAGASSPLIFTGIFLLPDSLFSAAGAGDSCSGYADVTPTLKLGDLSGTDGGSGDNHVNDEEDYPEIDPVYFYTTPDSPGDGKIDPGSGGGDAVDISWAVDPSDFSPANLSSVSWIKIVAASTEVSDVGEFSPEVDAVVRARRDSP